MNGRNAVLVVLILVVLVFAVYGTRLIHRGFSARDEPSSLERLLARTARTLSIPLSGRHESNPWKPTPEILKEAREHYLNRCATCHGQDGGAQTDVGRGLYPKPPDLRRPETQQLTDGELHYIIRNGVRLTGMPGWGNPHDARDDDSWKLVLFIRSLAGVTPAENTQEEVALKSAHYVGSQACEKCHADIYQRWKKTPMANVVRDPKEHPDAITPDLATNNVAKFTKDQVAFVYGSLWKQRYFTKVGDDYFPLGAQWDVTNKVWRPYMVAKGTDWWEPLYPPDNMQRPRGPPPPPRAPTPPASAKIKKKKKCSSGMWAASAATVPAVRISITPRAAT